MTVLLLSVGHLFLSILYLVVPPLQPPPVDGVLEPELAGVAARVAVGAAGDAGVGDGH